MLWLSVCFSTMNMFWQKQKSEKSLIQTKETRWIIPHFFSWGRTENQDCGKTEGNEKTYACKVWCSHCAKCEAQISNCLKGSRKARVMAFVEETTSFTKFQVNIYGKEYFEKPSSKHTFTHVWVCLSRFFYCFNLQHLRFFFVTSCHGFILCELNSLRWYTEIVFPFRFFYTWRKFKGTNSYWNWSVENIHPFQIIYHSLWVCSEFYTVV